MKSDQHSALFSASPLVYFGASVGVLLIPSLLFSAMYHVGLTNPQICSALSGMAAEHIALRSFFALIGVVGLIGATTTGVLYVVGRTSPDRAHPWWRQWFIALPATTAAHAFGVTVAVMIGLVLAVSSLGGGRQMALSLILPLLLLHLVYWGLIWVIVRPFFVHWSSSAASTIIAAITAVLGLATAFGYFVELQRFPDPCTWIVPDG